jgi:HEAT repeat protein
VRPLLFRALDEGDVDPAALAALSRAERRALDAQARALLPQLRGEDHDTLGRLLEREGAVAAARRQVHSGRAATRARAGEFLGLAGAADAWCDLVELLRDPDAAVRWQAAHALGQLGEPSSVPALLASVEGAHPLPVDLAADAIARIKDCPVSVVRQGLRSRSVPTRALAVELVGRLQALVATDEVIALLAADPSIEVRARAARALGRAGPPEAIGPLLACLGDASPALRAQALVALGRLGDAAAVGALRAVLVGPSRQLAELAGEALGEIGPAGVDVLTEVSAGDQVAAATAERVLARRRQGELAGSG